MSHSVPFLTLLILLPAVGAPGSLALLGSPSAISPRTLADARGRARLAGHPGRRRDRPRHMQVHDGGFQLVSNHTYTGETLGHPLVPRGRRDLASSWCC